METIDYHDVEPAEIMSGLTMRKVLSAESGAKHFEARIIEIKPGISHPVHSHWWEHAGLVLAGNGVFTDGKKEFSVGKDSFYFIHPNEPHGVANRGNEPFRFICLAPLATDEP